MNLRRELERRKGERDRVTRELKECTAQCLSLEKRAKHLQEALVVIQTVAQLTQKKLEYHISELVSLALDAVFPRPYTLHLDFIPKRNQSEALLTFSKGEDGSRIDPLGAAGGGPADVAAFALRVSLWSLRRPRTRNVLILDEPFKNLSKDLQPAASVMLKEISKKLKLQIIMVSHEPAITEAADRVFKVTMNRKGRSVVE